MTSINIYGSEWEEIDYQTCYTIIRISERLKTESLFGTKYYKKIESPREETISLGKKILNGLETKGYAESGSPSDIQKSEQSPDIIICKCGHHHNLYNSDLPCEVCGCEEFKSQNEVRISNGGNANSDTQSPERELETKTFDERSDSEISKAFQDTNNIINEYSLKYKPNNIISNINQYNPDYINLKDYKQVTMDEYNINSERTRICYCVKTFPFYYIKKENKFPKTFEGINYKIILTGDRIYLHEAEDNYFTFTKHNDLPLLIQAVKYWSENHE